MLNSTLVSVSYAPWVSKKKKLEKNEPYLADATSINITSKCHNDDFGSN